MRDYLVRNRFIYVSQIKFYDLEDRTFDFFLENKRKYYLTLNQRLFFYAALNL